MPLYEFQCRKCSHAFETLVRTEQDLPRACPKCGASRPTRLMSSFSATSSHPTNSETCPTGTCPLVRK